MRFGRKNNLLSALNSVVDIDINDKYSGISLELTIPSGGTVTFQGSYDGVIYNNISLRRISDGVYTQTSSISGAFVGSIVGLSKFRVKVTTVGSSSGTIVGSLSSEPALLNDGFGAVPHKFGGKIINTSFELTTVQNSGVLYSATSGNKFIITDLSFSIDFGAPMLLKIFDEIEVPTNVLFYENIPPTLSGNIVNINRNFNVPFVSSGNHDSIKINTIYQASGTLTARPIRGILRGYELDT